MVYFQYHYSHRENHMTFSFFTLASPFSVFVFIVNILFSFTIIFLERKTPQSTYAWLLFLWIN